MTDEHRAKIEQLLPGREGDHGRHGVDNRLLIDAVLYVVKTGIPCRDLPERFGKWNTVWRRFDRWCAAGVWAKLADVLNDADLEELHLDSTSIKAQHSTAGSLTRPDEKRMPRINDAAPAARVADGRPNSTRR